MGGAMLLSENEEVLHMLKPSPWLVVIWLFTKGIACSCLFSIFMSSALVFSLAILDPESYVLAFDAIFLQTMVLIF